MSLLTGERRRTVLTLVALIVLWEVAGRFHLVASGALPAPSAILARLWADRVVVLGGRPGRVTGTVEVTFERPRPTAIFRDATFHGLTDRVGELLGGEGV